MDDAKYPCRIEVPQYRGVNALRIEVGHPSPRCLHRPKTRYGRWLMANRPHHAQGDWSEFNPCTTNNGKGCAGCWFEIYDLDTDTYPNAATILASQQEVK